MRHPPLRSSFVVVLLALVAAVTWGAGARSAGDPRAVPGPAPDGRTRLPNGWLLSPAGRQVGVGDFPLGLAVSPDGRFAAVMHSGSRETGLDLVDLDAGVLVQRVPLPEARIGVAWIEGGRTLAVSGGHANHVLLFPVREGRAGTPDTLRLGPPWSAGGQYPQGRRMDYGPGAIVATGLAADESRGRLFVATRLDSAVAVLDLAGRRVVARLPVGAVPWTCLVSRDGRHVFVSCWSAGSVAVLDARTFEVVRTIAVGSHPTDLAESPDGRLFVAEANENTVSVVDPVAGRVTETLRTARSPGEAPGDTPNGLALDERGGRLYVANAGANHVAVFDVAVPGRSHALGFVPVGWYPSAIRPRPGHGEFVVANAKGAGSMPNATAEPDTDAYCRYLAYSPSARGTLSLVREPDDEALERFTRDVIANTPRLRRRPARRPPITHVFYVIKENRSYDQVLGDLPEGDGDSSLCLFGEDVTPNHHALAREFVLLDNTYCDADGSADGHNWGMGAYATDYVVKGVRTNQVYDYEGGNPLAYPRDGYLWDLCARHGVTYRSYGEFVFNGDAPGDTVRAGVPGLEGHVAPHYQGYDLTVSDLDRYQAWLEEFDRYDRDGGLPQVSIIRLANDHTMGTCEGQLTPEAFVAQNDLALGLMVERISRSRYWKGALVLVIEDDAANGQDHVDEHRTVALAAGPYVRRRAVDSSLYTGCSVLRCIEDVFGMPPMSQFDARANGLEGIFTTRPDFTPYRHRPARIDITETNVAGAYGQAESEAMDFSAADLVPYDVLNRVLWHSVRGTAAPAPPPVRSGFALGLRREGDADDDD